MPGRAMDRARAGRIVPVNSILFAKKRLLPILPPEMPRALGLPDNGTGLTYHLERKLSEYGLTNGAAFDFIGGNAKGLL